jgi:hypothetical protein
VKAPCALQEGFICQPLLHHEGAPQSIAIPGKQGIIENEQHKTQKAPSCPTGRMTLANPRLAACGLTGSLPHQRGIQWP